MDEAVAESRIPETCAKFLHGFVINELELNAVSPITNLDLWEGNVVIGDNCMKRTANIGYSNE